MDMDKYNLPRGYISYSAYTLWKSSKKGYRNRYYLNEEGFQTPQTMFGKATDEHLDNGGKIDGVIEMSHNQYKIEAEHEGLNLLGYLDAFDEPTLQILERKTGHLNPKGKAPWDRMKVRRHKQLVYYSILVEKKFGEVNEEVILQWLETRFKDESREFDGHILTTKSRKLELTGKIETFKRVIKDWERKVLLEDILLVAEEISNDYTEWKNQQTKK